MQSCLTSFTEVTFTETLVTDIQHKLKKHHSTAAVHSDSVPPAAHLRSLDQSDRSQHNVCVYKIEKLLRTF